MTENLKKTSVTREIFQWLEAIFLAILIAFLIRAFVFEPVYVEGPSMENTFFTSQRLIVYKLGYYFSPPKAGDVVILQYQEGLSNKLPIIGNLPIFKKAIPSISEVDYIKRVIAVPGDNFNIKDGYVYINNKKIKEPYIKEKGVTYNQSLELPMIIPKGKVLVLGDNRLNSRDSRQIGLIEYNRIKGKAVLRIWPLKAFGGIYSNMK
jgi:signal peptidase I, bacterial type